LTFGVGVQADGVLRGIVTPSVYGDGAAVHPGSGVVIAVMQGDWVSESLGTPLKLGVLQIELILPLAMVASVGAGGYELEGAADLNAHIARGQEAVVAGDVEFGGAAGIIGGRAHGFKIGLLGGVF
jgi:hypothetical protein